MVQPTNKQQLWGFVGTHFELWIPWKSFTEGHSSPLNFLADAYLHPGRDVAAWACRSGAKTLAASVLAAMEFLFTDGLETRVLSGSEDQARHLYEYWAHWCRTILRDRVEGNVQRQATAIAGGRLEILAASQRQVRGDKVHRLFEDELDEIDPDVDRAAVGMMASSEQLPARTVYTSTWHRVDGAMGRLIGGCPTNGVSLHRWNIWESIECCPEQRHQGGAGCDTCPLGGPCRAKARTHHGDPDRPVGIAAEAVGLYCIDDVCKAFLKVGRATWQAEYECRRPSVEGLVYPEFDELEHRCDDPPAELEMYRAIDWGLGVFVCLWLGVDKLDRVYLLDTYKAEQGTLDTHADYINGHRIRNVRATYCDPAGRNRNDQTGRSNIQLFRGRGIDCQYTTSPAAREIANGIRLIRAALRPAAGPPRFHYVPSAANRAFVKDIRSYRNRKVNNIYVDEPIKPQEADHTMDALRYFYVNRARTRGIDQVRLEAF